MGRYPLIEIGMRYMERRKAFLAVTTYEDLVRKVRYLSGVFVQLKGEGKVKTTNPAKMSREDIGSFIEHMRKTASQNYLAAITRFLKQLCEYSGNNVFAQMNAEGEQLPKKVPKDLKSLSEDDLERLRIAAESIEGWTGEVARFITAMYPYTGLRASELRLAHIDDLDTERWTIFVRHPKGEQRYARQRTAIILPPARKAVLRFLEARKERLLEHGYKNFDALIPAWWGGKFDFYEPSNFHRIKARIEVLTAQSGKPIKFQLKTFRDTYCQINIDRKPENLSAVSVSMGHATTRTTESHYGRLRNEKALRDLESAWVTDAPLKVNTPLIDRKYDNTGYA